MPSIAPFVGLVYDPSVVGPIGSVTAPPYDVIDEPARARYLASSPYSVAHLDLAGGLDGYEAAAEDLRRWRSEGALKEAGPCWFAYEMRTEPGATVRGIVCALALEDWGDGVIPHEMVMEGPVQDRLRLLESARVHPSAVYATVEGADPRLRRLLEETCRSDPFREAVDEEGVRHRMWTVPPDKPIGRWLGDAPLLMADGHHRYSTALLYRDQMRKEMGPRSGPWDHIPCFVVDEVTNAPQVLPYHRLSLEVPPQGLDDVSTPASDLGEVVGAIDDDAPSIGVIRADGSREVLRLAADPPAVKALHATVLQGVDAERLRYTPSAPDAERAVLTGAAAIAYILPPTTPARIREVLRRGQRLPQKSTFFWPKPRTGMVMMPLDEGTLTTFETPRSREATDRGASQS